MIPRRDCLGLIEAANNLYVASADKIVIPRRDCLGLIEAFHANG